MRLPYPSASGRTFATEFLRLVADTAGASFPALSNDLAPIVAQLEADLRRGYVLGSPPERLRFGKLHHEIRIEVTQPDLSVRARRTYGMSWESSAIAA